MTPPAFIRGESVTLRPADENDLEFLVENINNPDIWQSVKTRRPMTEETEREWLQSLNEGNDVPFLIYAGGEPVGSIGLHEVNEKWGTYEVGFWVAPDEQQNGYGTEGCELAVGYAFNELRVEKVVAEVFAFNDASRRLLESVGFVHEATLRKHAYAGGERVDLLIYGLLASEFGD